MKKTLSVLIACLLLISALPFGTSAATETSGITGDCIWHLNDTVLTISGNGAMGDCDSKGYAPPWGWEAKITKVIIKPGVTNIGGNMFSLCSSLTSITIPNSVKSIGYYAFGECRSLTYIIIPDGVESIEGQAFDGCSSLTSITISDSVASIGLSAFEDTAYYNNANNWNNGVLYIDRHLIDTDYDISGTYKIKEGTLVIADWAFGNRSNLTSITIPDGVTNIGRNSFCDCGSLTSIIIPNSVKSIGYSAFDSCNKLTVYGYHNTEAEKYAKRSGISFIYLDGDIIRGD